MKKLLLIIVSVLLMASLCAACTPGSVVDTLNSLGSATPGNGIFIATPGSAMGVASPGSIVVAATPGNAN